MLQCGSNTKILSCLCHPGCGVSVETPAHTVSQSWALGTGVSAVDRGGRRSSQVDSKPAVVEHGLEEQCGPWISWWEELVHSDVIRRHMPRGLF